MTQALVAVGGRATRLRSTTAVPVSKAFLPGPAGRPFLYWCLLALEQAGIERVEIAVDHSRQDEPLAKVLDSRLWNLETRVFRDKGLGVHGIPWQARARLDDVVLFDAGHNVSKPDHYRSLIAMAQSAPRTVVFSAFRPRPDNPRFRVAVDEIGRVCADGEVLQALAHPMIVDHFYIGELPVHRFDVAALARSYLARGALRVVRTNDPVEFDIDGEYRRTKNLLWSNADDCAEGTPWMAHPRPGAVEPTQGIPAVV